MLTPEDEQLALELSKSPVPKKKAMKACYKADASNTLKAPRANSTRASTLCSLRRVRVAHLKTVGKWMPRTVKAIVAINAGKKAREGKYRRSEGNRRIASGRAAAHEQPVRLPAGMLQPPGH